MNGIIFDLDGTLLNTVPDLATAANAMLAHYGVRTITQQQVMDYLGHGLGRLVERALPAEAHIDPQEALGVFSAAYAQVYRDQTQPYEGILDLVDELVKRKIPLAVVSNKAQPFLDGLVERHFPHVPFCAVIGERHDLPRKPDPLGLFTAVKAMGVRVDDAVLVGDTEVDAQAAMNAGMPILGVAWGFRPVSALREAGVQRILEHPQEMLELMNDYAIME